MKNFKLNYSDLVSKNNSNNMTCKLSILFTMDTNH